MSDHHDDAIAEALFATIDQWSFPEAHADDFRAQLTARGLSIVAAGERRDAARYRWLRSRDLDAVHSGGVFVGKTPDNLVLNLEDCDAAIDAALALAGGTQLDPPGTVGP